MYWQHTLAGVLTDFDLPWGECVDESGDVYIADFDGRKVVEYAHGGTKPTRSAVLPACAYSDIVSVPKSVM